MLRDRERIENELKTNGYSEKYVFATAKVLRCHRTQLRCYFLFFVILFYSMKLQHIEKKTHAYKKLGWAYWRNIRI
jgi:hypothetical protein